MRKTQKIQRIERNSIKSERIRESPKKYEENSRKYEKI